MKIILIDGSAILHRAYYAYPRMLDSSGNVVNAIYGFCDLTWNLLDKFKSEMTHIAMVFDSGGKTFRHDMYPEYKANRKAKDPDLAAQYIGVREASRAFNISVIEKRGVEADDIIATYAARATKVGGVVIIVSGDKDLQQLVTSGHQDFGVTIYDPMKMQIVGRVQVFEKFGVSPHQVADVQAIAGDATDNVPGVHGVGIKGAAKLIQQFGSLENLYNNVHQIDKPKLAKLISDSKDKAFLSKKLVTLDKEIEMDEKLEDFVAHPHDSTVLYNFFESKGFTGLIVRLEKEAFE